MILYSLLLVAFFLSFYNVLLLYFISFKPSGLVYKTVFLDGALLPEFYVKEAKSIVDRAVGLRNHYSLSKHQSLLLKGKIISTYGMSFPIDILFLNKHGHVLHIYTNAMPSKIFFYALTKTKYVLETKSGVTSALNIKKGSQLKFSRIID